MRQKDLKTIFAERLKYARSYRQLTQEDLAAMALTCHTTICHYESIKSKRSPNIIGIYNLARALRVSSDYLLGLKESILE